MWLSPFALFQENGYYQIFNFDFQIGGSITGF